jgi:hypothetical protein
MAAQNFQDELRNELERTLLGMNDLQPQIPRMYCRLDGGYAFTIQEIAKILKRNPDETTFLINKIVDRLAKQELLYSLPHRSHKLP